MSPIAQRFVIWYGAIFAGTSRTAAGAARIVKQWTKKFKDTKAGRRKAALLWVEDLWAKKRKKKSKPKTKRAVARDAQPKKRKPGRPRKTIEVPYLAWGRAIAENHRLNEEKARVRRLVTAAAVYKERAQRELAEVEEALRKSRGTLGDFVKTEEATQRLLAEPGFWEAVREARALDENEAVAAFKERRARYRRHFPDRGLPVVVRPEALDTSLEEWLRDALRRGMTEHQAYQYWFGY